VLLSEQKLPVQIADLNPVHIHRCECSGGGDDDNRCNNNNPKPKTLNPKP
jgi:hypothetical protein